MFPILKICQYLNMQIECQSKLYSHTLSWWRRSSCWTWRFFWTAWIWAQNKAKWIEFHTTLTRKKTNISLQRLSQPSIGQHSICSLLLNWNTSDLSTNTQPTPDRHTTTYSTDSWPIYRPCIHLHSDNTRPILGQPIISQSVYRSLVLTDTTYNKHDPKGIRIDQMKN